MTAKKPTKARAVLRSRSKAPGRGPVQTIAVRFPLAYLNILEAEADQLGVTRGQLLTMLVKRKRGEIVIERGSKQATEYSATDDELRTTRLYVWQVAPKDRQSIDEERLGMGNIGVAAFLIHLINHWLGKPMGLRS
jgi:hypothetical protein